MPGFSKRNAYKDAIDRVRSEHRDTIAPNQTTMECPKCGTKQVIPDAPGLRRCSNCGFEFRPWNARNRM